MSSNWFELYRNVEAILRRTETSAGELTELRNEVKQIGRGQANLNDKIEELGRNFERKLDKLGESMKRIPEKLLDSKEMKQIFEMSDVYEGYCDMFSTDNDRILAEMSKLHENLTGMQGRMSSEFTKIITKMVDFDRHEEMQKTLNELKDSFDSMKKTSEENRENTKSNVAVCTDGDSLSTDNEGDTETVKWCRICGSSQNFEKHGDRFVCPGCNVLQKAPYPKAEHMWRGVTGCPPGHFQDVSYDAREGESIECVICGNKGKITGLPSARRLMKEFLDITNSGIKKYDTVEIDRNDYRHWNIILLPELEPYDKGAFRVRLDFPKNYPFDRPRINFLTKIYHPNFNENGELCAHTFCCRMEWKPSMHVEEMMKMLLELIHEPELKNPWNVDKAEQFTKDRKKFNEAAEEFTKKYAEKRPK